MKLISFLLITLFVYTSFQLSAQDKSNAKFNKISPEDFTLPGSPVIDSSSNAVIIADAGITTFKGNNQGWVSYVYSNAGPG